MLDGVRFGQCQKKRLILESLRPFSNQLGLRRLQLLYLDTAALAMPQSSQIISGTTYNLTKVLSFSEANDCTALAAV